MGINLCRHDPKRFIPIVKRLYKENVLLAKGQGKKMNELVAKLTAQQPLSPVRFDQQANQACRDNNAAVIEKDEQNPTLGGNIAKFTELSGQDKSAVCSEFTMLKFPGSTGDEFVALQLALDFEGLNSGAKKDGAEASATAAAKPATDAAAA